MGSILVTGAGSGFGREIALRLAEQKQDVIAAVEIAAQIFDLSREAEQRGVALKVEMLDVTHEKAAGWDKDVLLNNAGISDGGRC